MPEFYDVKVERAISEDQDLGEYMSKVRAAVRESYSSFGAADEWDLCVQEIRTAQVVVRDREESRYIRADYSVDGEDISFSNIKVVKRQWEVVGDIGVVQRDKDEVSEFVYIQEEKPTHSSFWNIDLLP
ncbi:MAG: hypothetical protein KAS32_19585 [Candidatus Peribacteraceae bacterium]|nr:hypothetical protein [Candidatus Peribacteraceae bacterium]